MINTYAFAIEDNLILSGESALLIDYDTGGVLYEKKS